MSDGAAEGFVLKPGEGRSIDFSDEVPVSVLADREGTGGPFSLLETKEGPGTGVPLHAHRDAAEAFYVLEGEYIVSFGGRDVTCPTGSFIFIPARVPHAFTTGNMVSRKLNLYAPAAMVGYFDDLGEAIRQGTADEELLSEIAARYSMEVLGPIPEGYL